MGWCAGCIVHEGSFTFTPSMAELHVSVQPVVTLRCLLRFTCDKSFFISIAVNVRCRRRDSWPNCIQRQLELRHSVGCYPDWWQCSSHHPLHSLGPRHRCDINQLHNGHGVLGDNRCGHCVRVFCLPTSLSCDSPARLRLCLRAYEESSQPNRNAKPHAVTQLWPCGSTDE